MARKDIFSTIVLRKNTWLPQAALLLISNVFFGQAKTRGKAERSEAKMNKIPGCHSFMARKAVFVRPI
jgi:hypothetical protein